MKYPGFFFFFTETAYLEPPQKAVYSKHSIAIHSISMAGYVNRRTGFCPCRAMWPGYEQFL